MKYYLETFGCRANQYDSEAVRAMVQRGGGSVVNGPDEADVAVFNSCAVTAEAEVDLRKSVRRVARRAPGLRSVIMGCAAARDTGALAALPGVSHVVPGADFPSLSRALALPDAQGTVTPSQQSGTRALLRIQDGCDEHCTFCATTLARGANRSRSAGELVREAHALADRHPEIVLTGVHIGTWGADSGSSLGVLVERLVHAVPRVRFRLSSVEATEVDDRLRELLGEPARLAPHLHAPLQSGADRVLRRMGRHWYTARAYAAAVERLAAALPVFGLGADVIAGFPGETDDEHAATLRFVAGLPFTYLHVFPYSSRPGTPAERLPDAVPGPTVKARARQLREAGAERQRLHRARRAGERSDVIVIRGAEREGLTEDYLTVRTPAGAGRGARFAATLRVDDSDLVAEPACPAAEVVPA